MSTNNSPSIFPLLAPQKGKIITASLLSIIAKALGLAPFIIVYLMAIALLNPPYDQTYIWKLVIANFIIALARWILSWISGVLSHIAAYNFLYDIRIKLSEKFGTLSLGYFNSHSTGTLQKVMNEDVEYLELAVAHGFSDGISLITTFLFTTIYLFTVDWRMTLAALGAFPLTILSQILLFGDLKPFTETFFSKKDRMNSTIIEYIQGMPVIKAFTQTTKSFTQFQDTVSDYQGFQTSWVKKSLFPSALFTMSITANLIVILPVGIWFLNNGTLSIPTLILFLLLGIGLCAPLFKFISVIRIYVQTQEGIKRIFDILNEPALSEPQQSSITNDLTIEFKDVYFSYQNKEVLQGVNLVIPEGSITALVGPSGSGKTTIARLIARFWDVKSGEICLGGVNIKNLKTQDLMSKIAVVFQDVMLFNDTVYENIRMGNPDADEKAVVAAAKAAACHEFIEAMPEGYQTVVGEKGVKLSGGQQQRISIARAILKDAPIIILDEATAFIDPENEAQIQEAINRLVQSKTLLIIAHRLSTITETDQIILVDEGRIVGNGKHEELLKNNALYRQMWSAHVTAQSWTFEVKQPVGFVE
ncbi:MAG: ABC transporter ATP-binding protein/permease [Desmonostoc geniculatum HA4340-LM1]|jgi:ATP-binding cassette subfamily B protein|nr:ABC transporter ATP-binding protein/permease [Desmonostoc geniculatum HA4340-LM1]